MDIFYMNQGQGDFGPVDYGRFDVLLIAENNRKPPPSAGARIDGQGYEFELVEESATDPSMAIFEKGRFLRNLKNINRTGVGRRSPRPLYCFSLKGSLIYIVFMHLKSANVGAANEDLERAKRALTSDFALSSSPKNMQTASVLWVGDFNRANYRLPYTRRVWKGGGVAGYNLDRVVLTGPSINISVSCITKNSGDNNHIGMWIHI